MMRALLGALALCLATTAPAADRSPEFSPLSVEVKLVQLSPRVYFVQGDSGAVSRANEGFNSNAGFVVTPEGVVVFDALGTPSLGRELLRAIRSVTDAPIRKVVVSHYHADHMYGLQVFKQAGAEIWAQRNALPYLASEAPQARLAERRESLAPWVNDKTHIVPPDRLVDQQDGFTLGGFNFRLFRVGPAHTDEDLAMLVEEEGVLFIGDLVFAGRIPFVGDADSRAWLEAIDTLSKYKPRIMVGGHGPPSREATGDLAMTRDYLLYLRERMGRAVDEGTPFEEAYTATDWGRFAALPAFDAANKRNAYNTYLLMEREALAGLSGAKK
jgi:glyoxylase-like metal-dependent hydrolase (beta-lactamase superfamily II)